MTLSTIREILLRDIGKLEQEIELYQNHDHLWVILPGIANSGGNLVLHLAGNLRHFIGETLGHSGYVRNRDLEFSDRGKTREELIELVRTTASEVSKALGSLHNHDLPGTFPLQKHGEQVTTLHMLIHLSTHLSYHLGQINYHRRIVSANG